MRMVITIGWCIDPAIRMECTVFIRLNSVVIFGLQDYHMHLMLPRRIVFFMIVPLSYKHTKTQTYIWTAHQTLHRITAQQQHIIMLKCWRLFIVGPTKDLLVEIQTDFFKCPLLNIAVRCASLQPVWFPFFLFVFEFSPLLRVSSFWIRASSSNFGNRIPLPFDIIYQMDAHKKQKKKTTTTKKELVCVRKNLIDRNSSKWTIDLQVGLLYHCHGAVAQ